MKKLCFFAMVMCLVCSNIILADTLVSVDSCRTSLNNGTTSDADLNKSNSSKLSIRSDNKAAKSWIKFDVRTLDSRVLAECKLRITLHAPKDNTCLLSAVNDDCTTNIDWTDSDLTWNNGPGNIISSDGVNPDEPGFTLANLQSNLDPTKTTLIGTVDYSEGSGGVAGGQYFIDVLSIVQADTDGVVQFVLHGSGGSTDFATHDHPEGAEYSPTLVYSSVPTGNCPDVGTLYSEYADDSCRTELFNGTISRADDNRSDNSKLSVRGDYKGNKSWIKLDISDLQLDQNYLKAATLRVTLHASKDNTCLLSAVNDDYTTNIGWNGSDLTWNNAPGNITSSDGVNPNDGSFTAEDLQGNLDPTKTTFISVVDYSQDNGGVSGDQFFIDVLPIIQADTDGVIQFILHGAGGSTNFATHNHSSGEEYWPRLDIIEGPKGADVPYPCPDDMVGTDLLGMSWTNPDPNGTGDITCTVYLGTDPNRLNMDSVTLSPDTQSVLINETNFPNSFDEVNGGLYNNTRYYWTVDCQVPNAGLIDGMMWDFLVNDNTAPTVDAGPDQVIWLGLSGIPGQEVVNLDGITSDDGLPDPPATYTVDWTQVDNGAPAVVIDPISVDDTYVTITERGDYEFMLTADDGKASASDAVRIVVGDDSCDASHINTGLAYDDGDMNMDCIIDLQDFALLIATNWLDCTDTLMDCGN